MLTRRPRWTLALVFLTLLIALPTSIGGVRGQGNIPCGSAGNLCVVTFAENGLPGGTSWSVSITGNSPNSSSSTSSSISFDVLNGTYTFSVGGGTGYQPTPSSGPFDISGSNLTGSNSIPISWSAIPPTDYQVTFSESGLPSGRMWTVALQGLHAKSSATSTIVFSPGEPNGSWSFSVSAAGYTPTPPNGQVVVNGEPASQLITFTVLAYPVTFTESGLPGGQMWSVTLNGNEMSSPTSTIVFSEPNGSWPFTVSPSGDYSPNPGQGNVNVNAGPAGESITFNLQTYPVTFTETGLPTGTDWSVTINGVNQHSTTTTVQFSEVNGSYPFTIQSSDSKYRPSPASATVNVNGKGVGQSVNFILVTYPITFTESGLLTGTAWAITLLTLESSTTPTIVFSEPNGTYSFTVGSVFGWTPNEAGGQVTVAGGPQGVTITWTEDYYTLTFLESGLPSGAAWSVDILGSNQSSTTPQIVFSEPDGNYSFSVTPPPGYQAVPRNASVVIAGSNQEVSINFPQFAYNVVFNETGLNVGTKWGISINGYEILGNTSVLTTQEANGTYTFLVPTVRGYSSNVTGGNFQVAGAAAVVYIRFSAYVYEVSFFNNQLPQSTNWTVTLNGIPLTGPGSSSINFFEANGTYNYSVSPVIRFILTGATGSVMVNGHPLNLQIIFIPVATWSVEFIETGLAPGTAWSVSIGGFTVFAPGTNFTAILLPNGNWSYYLGYVAGYTQPTPSGEVYVDGANQTVMITFVPGGGGGVGPPKGFSEAEIILIASSIIASLIIGVALFVRMRHRSDQESPASSSTISIDDSTASPVDESM